MQDAKDYGQEVNEFINQFCIVEECKNGRWMAYLDPAHDFVRTGAQPPGQINVYHAGESTYSAENALWVEGQGPAFQYKASGNWRLVWPIDLGQSKNRVLWNTAWAARPCFKTSWGARAKIEEWVRQNRPDIVREAERNAREAMAYRRKHAEDAHD